MAIQPKDETVPVPSQRAESVDSSSFDNAREMEPEEKSPAGEEEVKKDDELSKQKSTTPSEIEYDILRCC